MRENKVIKASAPVPIVVDCTIGGSAKQLMFDTGASMIALNKEFEREKSAVMGKGTSQSGETFTIPTGIGPAIEIQSLKITKPTCMFTDLSSVSGQLGSQVVGILGMDPLIAHDEALFQQQ